MSTPTHAAPLEWAQRLRALPAEVRAVVEPLDDRAQRARPAPGEWSVIEILGHLVDKLELWRERVDRIVREERPFLPGYDQDASVRDRGYQSANGTALLAAVADACERFAVTTAALSEDMLAREGVHGEMGRITLRDCVAMPVEAATAHLAQMRAAIAEATRPP